MEVNGGQWRSMEVNEGQWRSMEVNGGQWRSMEVNRGQWRSMEVNGGQWSGRWDPLHKEESARKCCLTPKPNPNRRNLHPNLSVDVTRQPCFVSAARWALGATLVATPTRECLQGLTQKARAVVESMEVEIVLEP